MNKKRAFKTDAKVEFLHDVEIKRGSRTYALSKGMLVSIHKKPGLPAGRYEFLYAERDKDDELLLTVEGRMSQAWEDRRRRIIREADIRTVHLKTKRG